MIRDTLRFCLAEVGFGAMQDRDESAPTKKETLESLLPLGDVLVQLDPRVPGVNVPTWLREQPLLVLRVGLDMPVPIPDLEVTEIGMQATLSFQREPHHCRVPWNAVFGMISVTGRAYVWANDVPKEVASEIARDLVKAETRHLAKVQDKGALLPVRQAVASKDESPDPNGTGVTVSDSPVKLGIIDGGLPLRSPGNAVSENEPSEEPPPPSPKGHLRLVK